MKKTRSICLILSILLVSLFGITPAQAEQIPVLTWERGQTQSVVLGQGDTNQKWDLYLLGGQKQKSFLAKSVKNSEGFLVYSISIPGEFELGGYVLEAKNDEGEVKQVAGVQIVAKINSEITRTPIELLLVILAFSLFLILLQMSNNKTFNRQSDTVEYLSYPKSRSITIKLLNGLENDSKISMVKTILIDELRFDLFASKISSFFGVSSLFILSLMQLQKGNWLISNELLLILSIGLGSIFVTNGVILFLISSSFLVLNIALAKSLSDFLAIFVISSLFVVPALVNQWLMKIFYSELSFIDRQKEIVINFLSALVTGFLAFQMIVVFESLITIGTLVEIPKSQLSFFIVVAFAIKNNFLILRIDSQQTFQVIRSIGPIVNITISIILGLITYIWTTNFLVSVAVFAISLISIAFNWLNINFNIRFQFPRLTLFFNTILVFSILLGFYFSIQTLPMDVINRSHLFLLLAFILNLIVGTYNWIVNISSKVSQS